MENEEQDFRKFLNGIEDKGADAEMPAEELYDFTERKPEAVKADAEEGEETEEVPFHKNPKLAKFIEREVSKRLSDHKPEPTVQQTAPSNEDEDPLELSLTELIGNDTPEKVAFTKRFMKSLEGRDQKVKQEAVDALQARENASRQAEIDAQKEVSSALEDIEDTYNVDITSPKAAKLKSDFLDFVGRMSPKDMEGNIVSYADFKESFKAFKDMNRTPSNDRAKALANRSISNTAATSAQQTVDSFDEFAKWKDNLSN